MDGCKRQVEGLHQENASLCGKLRNWCGCGFPGNTGIRVASLALCISCIEIINKPGNVPSEFEGEECFNLYFRDFTWRTRGKLIEVRQECLKILHSCTHQPSSFSCLQYLPSQTWLLGTLCAAHTGHFPVVGTVSVQYHSGPSLSMSSWSWLFWSPHSNSRVQL